MKYIVECKDNHWYLNGVKYADLSKNKQAFIRYFIELERRRMLRDNK